MNMLAPFMHAMDRLDAEDRARYRSTPQGLSDDTKRAEHKAQALVLPAIAALRSACQDAMLLSDIQHDQLQRLLNVLDDEAPTQDRWDEKLAEANQ